MSFYTLETVNILGGRGDILINGYLDEYDLEPIGTLGIVRTGPFAPPVSLLGIGNMVVSQDFKKKLESSGFEGLSFRTVEKKKVVELHWELWDRERDIPPEEEIGNEREIFRSQPHSPEVARKLGNLYLVIPPVAGSVDSETTPNVGSGIIFYFDKSTWSGEPIFRARTSGGRFFEIMVSEEGKRWFEANAGDWLRFEKAVVQQ